MLHNLAYLLKSPIVFGLTHAISSLCFFVFWGYVFTPRKFIPKVAKYIFALYNAVIAAICANAGLISTSPFQVCYILSFFIMAELMILGRLPKKWGYFTFYAINSFQFVTVYSVSNAIFYLGFPTGISYNKTFAIIPVALTNLLLSIVLLSLHIYRKKTKYVRDEEISEIFCSKEKSLFFIIFCLVNSLAVSYLLSEAIRIIFITSVSDLRVKYNLISLLIRDSVLFFSTILILDFQTRVMRNEKYIQMAHDKSKKLEDDIVAEKNLRSKLRRNVLFRFTVNLTKGVLDDSGTLNFNVLDGRDSTTIPYEELIGTFLGLLVHEDDTENLKNVMSLDYLNSIEHTEKGYEVPFKLSPKSLINHIALDDDNAKIFSYVDRDYIWTNLDCAVMRMDSGDLFAFFYILDVDEKKQQEEVIKKAASTDALTGLLNRASFAKLLKDYLSDDNNAGGTLFMFDLDFFKSVNDNLGHPKGDELLIDVANILSSTFRTEDIVCRIGGDEFCAFAKGFVNEEQIRERASQLNELGRKEFKIPNTNRNIKVSFSIGIASVPKDTKDASTLYLCADKALYQAKENGRDQFKTYSI